MTESRAPEALFHAALQRSTDDERAAYLDEACGDDPALRRRVERLLAAHRRAGGFLERPIVAAGPPSLAPPPGGSSPVDPATPPAGGPSLDFLTPSPRPDALGRLGPFEVLEAVGEGGIGFVLRAFDAKLHRAVAIKTLAPALAAIGPARRRFLREARSAASVIHENVIAIHAVEDAGPVPYLVMPFIDGPTLQQRLDRDGPQSLGEVLRIGRQIAAGLAAAHAQGLGHRDVKPSNILLENGVERVKITDFGLARVVDDPGLTMPGLIADTPAYMSPEQAGGEPVDHRSDLFSLGSVLYALCTGLAPFRGETMLSMLRHVSDKSPRPVRQLNPEIPAWLGTLVARLHTKDPAKGPQTAAEVTDLLGRRLAELQEPAPGAYPPAPVRSRWWLPIAALALLALGLGTTETTGVTNMRGTVIRLLFPDGTLAVEVDDPSVSVAVGDTDLVITGSGVREIRLKPGAYRVKACKDGKVVRQELAEVVREGRQVVRISKESAPPTAEEDHREPSAPPSAEKDRWKPSVAGLPAQEKLDAVGRRSGSGTPASTARCGRPSGTARSGPWNSPSTRWPTSPRFGCSAASTGSSARAPSRKGVAPCPTSPRSAACP